MYDDKDLSVNDEVELIDKVDPDNPTTWKVIGVARIDEILQKRLGELTTHDQEGHERFASKTEMLKTYQRYYGLEVAMGTPVKIVKFSFTPVESKVTEKVDRSTTIYTEVKLYTDGGSRGNPGPSALGYAIMDMDDHIVVKKGVYLGITTNNQAEYQSLKQGLEEAQKLQAREVHVYMDSLLVVKQMQGAYKVRNRDLWPIHAAIKDLVTTFSKVTFTHVPRELNKIADSAVNEALDEALHR